MIYFLFLLIPCSGNEPLHNLRWLSAKSTIMSFLFHLHPFPLFTTFGSSALSILSLSSSLILSITLIQNGSDPYSCFLFPWTIFLFLPLHFLLLEAGIFSLCHPSLSRCRRHSRRRSRRWTGSSEEGKENVAKTGGPSLVSRMGSGRREEGISKSWFQIYFSLLFCQRHILSGQFFLDV